MNKPKWVYPLAQFVEEWEKYKWPKGQNPEELYFEGYAITIKKILVDPEVKVYLESYKREKGLEE